MACSQTCMNFRKPADSLIKQKIQKFTISKSVLDEYKAYFSTGEKSSYTGRVANLLQKYGSYITDLTVDYYDQFYTEHLETSKLIVIYCTQLRHYKVEYLNYGVDDEGDYQIIPDLSKLESLPLCHFGTFVERALGKCSGNLKSFSFDYGKFDQSLIKCMPKSLTILRQLKFSPFLYEYVELNPHLKELELIVSHSGDCDILRLCKHLKDIEHLVVDGWYGNNIASVSTLPKLINLTVNSALFTNIEINSLLQALANTDNVRSLNVSAFGCMAFDDDTVNSLVGFTQLQTLVLGDFVKCTRQTFNNILKNLSGNTDLRNFDITVSVPKLSFRQAAESLQSLETLCINTREYVHISSISKLTNLRKFEIVMSAPKINKDQNRELNTLFHDFAERNILQELRTEFICDISLMPETCMAITKWSNLTKLRYGGNIDQNSILFKFINAGKITELFTMRLYDQVRHMKVKDLKKIIFKLPHLKVVSLGIDTFHFGAYDVQKIIPIGVELIYRPKCKYFLNLWVIIVSKLKPLVIFIHTLIPHKYFF